MKDRGPGLQFDRRVVESYEPVMPPDLLPDEDVGFDFEYKPVRDPCFSDPFSVAVYSGQRQQGWYLPWAHMGGGNLPRENVWRWLHTNLVNRTVHCTNAKAEAHMLYQMGLDPERLRVNFTDIAFNAALLNENRYEGFSLEALCEEYLPPEERKVHPGLTPDQFYMGHASEVAERCIADARQAYLIHHHTWPMLQAENLEQAWALENRCILPTVEMERNGALIDRPKLERWLAACEDKIALIFLQVFRDTKLRVNPDKGLEMQALFDHLGMQKPVAWDDASGAYVPSFSDDALETVKHPIIQSLQLLRKLKSLKSKYLLKYLNALDAHNVLRYQLHQLRTDNDAETGTRGTVTGRYSCGGGEFSVNVQQVWKAVKQAKKMGDDFIIRELYIAEPGRQVGASDAEGIEFRLFGHYSKSKFIRETYEKDPHTDFHLMVTRMMNPGVTDLAELTEARNIKFKNMNFAKVYGVGRPKLTRQLGLACVCPYDWNERDDHHRIVRWFGQNGRHLDGCPARRGNDIIDGYDDKFPEAETLVAACAEVAKTRGYVMTMLKRRRRYPTGARLYSALNAICQGSAAEYFKVKLAELFEARKTLNIKLRIPKHDEHVYDIDPDPAAHTQVQDLLDSQSWPQLTIPLLWSSGFGDNWAEANGFFKGEHV